MATVTLVRDGNDQTKSSGKEQPKNFVIYNVTVGDADFPPAQFVYVGRQWLQSVGNPTTLTMSIDPE